MSKKKRNNNITWLIVCVVSLVVIVLAVKGITAGVRDAVGTEQKQEDNKEAQQEDSKETEQETETEAETSSSDESEAIEVSDASDGGEAVEEPQADKEDFTLADLDNPEGFDERPAKNGFVLQNTQISLDGLDATSLDWGQGGDKDQYNRPAGCLQYQEKYGKYNANFIVDEPEKKVIYLTFDEGYEYGCSPSILDTLKEKNVHAVFFVTKPYVEQEPELVQRMIDEGHEVGNHSVTHPSMGLPSQNVEQQTYEVTETHRYVKEQFGYDMHLFRYPTGRFSEQSVALLNNLNYKTVFWSFAYLDYDVNNQPNEAESLQKMIDCLHPGAIYLLHAESETNTSVLGDFIDQARAQGYEFKLFE